MSRFPKNLIFGIYVLYLLLSNESVFAQYSLVTSEPFATRDKEFMLTCNIGFTETATVLTWSRNVDGVVNIRISDCYTGPAASQELYNSYRYNCTTSTRRYNLIIPTPRINSEADSQWKCGPSVGGADSNTYTLKFYSPPTGDPVITGYDGAPRFLGNNVTLTCTVNGGIPLATITWTCKGTSVPGTSSGRGTHTVTIDTSYNGQSCTCTAAHPTWTIDKFAQSKDFVVHNKPSADPVISGYNGSVLYQGNTVKLTCQVSGGSPLANLSWTCDGKPQAITTSHTSGSTVTRVLTIILKSEHNGKTCICHGRHSDPSYIPDIACRAFIVYYPPSDPILYPLKSSQFPWLEGRNGTLNCSSQPGNPPNTTYQWMKENATISGEIGTLLKLTSLTKTDNRKSFKCKVANDYTVYKQLELVSQARQLDVEYRPLIDIGTSPVYVRETETFVRACTADSNPNSTIIWTPNMNPSDRGTLKFVNIIRNQTGDYTCKAEAQSKGGHGLLSNQAVLKVIVKYPPSVQAVISSASVKEGQGVLMVCQAEGVPNQYTYNGWTQIYKNKIIRTSKDFSTESQDKRNLTLSVVSYHDIGTYKCSAENGVSDKDGNQNQEGESDLDIRFSAVFNSSRTFYSELNRTVGIRIPFFCNPFVNKVDDIFLTRDNEDLKNNSGIAVNIATKTLQIELYDKVISVNGQEVIVSIQSFSSKLQGNYSVGVKNFGDESLSTFVFEVIPSGPPEKPKRFGVLSKTSKSITVTWLKGFNGGHQQTFVILYIQKGGSKQSFFKEVMEEENRDNYTLKFTNLLPLTEYDFWIYSYNIKGNNTNDLKKSSPVVVKTTENGKDDNKGIIIGVVAAVLCVIIVLGVIGGILFIRRRSQGAKGKSNGLVNGTSSSNGEEQNANEEEDGMRVNILYESAGPNYKKAGTAGEGAIVELKKKKGNKPGMDNPAALYSQVEKTKPPADSSAVYAEVVKSNKNQKEGANTRKLFEGTKKGMLYENVENIKKDKNDDANIYESTDEVPEPSTGAIPKPKKSKPKKTVKKNKDGLIYADLELEFPKQNGDKKVVVHGIENRTDYAEVDFSRRAAPLEPEKNQNK